MEENEMKALIHAIQKQTEGISAFSIAVMKLVEAVNILIDEGENGEPSTYLSGEKIE